MSDDARREVVATLNAWTPDEAARELSVCCAGRRWADALAAGRPYPGWSERAAAATAAMEALAWSDVQEALDAHPRIGDRIAGQTREAMWSRAEQSAAADGTGSARRELLRLNAEYESAFGHVFLIRAAGRSIEQILVAAGERLGHDRETEQRVVRAELAEIALLRLERLGAGPAATIAAVEAVAEAEAATPRSAETRSPETGARR